MEQESGDVVVLGFLSPISSDEKHLTNRRYFPSKVGGKPAWLIPEGLPSAEELSCDKCGYVMTFLLQIYNGNADRPPYHRSILVLCCQECSDKFMVLRAQLPKDNPYFPYESLCDVSGSVAAAARTDQVQLDEKLLSGLLCNICGLPQRNQIDRVEEISNSDVDMEALHITASEANTEVPTNFNTNLSRKGGSHMRCRNAVTYHSLRAVFDEFLLDEELENLIEHKSSTQKAEEEKALQLYNSYLSNATNNPEDQLDDSECTAFEEIHNESLKSEDGVFTYFKYRCCELNSEISNHVLRYCYNGKPLWHSKREILENTEKVPRCENCGAVRVFEFQIQPTLLAYSTFDRLQFATLSIYTCSNSCDPIGPRSPDWPSCQYLREFIYCQKDAFFPTN